MFLGEGNGTPLQYSCLENPMDRGAWKAAVQGGRWGSDTTERLHFHFSLSCIGEGNGNPLQCSCLENPRDGGAWWAAVYGITQSRTRLKWLSSSSSSMFLQIYLFILWYVYVICRYYYLEIFYWSMLIYNVQLILGIEQSDSVLFIYILWHILYLISYYKLWSIVPCAV